MTYTSNKPERFVVAYNPGIGRSPVPKSEVIATVRDYLADLDDVEEDEIKVVASRNLPADDQYYVFDTKLITELAS